MPKTNLSAVLEKRDILPWVGIITLIIYQEVFHTPSVKPIISTPDFVDSESLSTYVPFLTWILSGLLLKLCGYLIGQYQGTLLKAFWFYGIIK